MIRQKIPALLTAEPERPAFAQGETEDRPIPVPRSSRISERAAATKAPAMIADNETPDVKASLRASPPGFVGESVPDSPS